MLTDPTTDRTEANLNEGLTNTFWEIARTDTKAGHLFALNGLLVASLSLLGKDARGASLVLAVVGVVALVTSVVLSVFVILPRFGAPGGVSDRSSFVYWAEIADLTDLAASLRDDRRLRRLQVGSRIVLRKMRILRHSAHASVLALVTIAAAILAR